MASWPWRWDTAVIPGPAAGRQGCRLPGRAGRKGADGTCGFPSSFPLARGLFTREPFQSRQSQAVPKPGRAADLAVPAQVFQLEPGRKLVRESEEFTGNL
jgi:hypothetical protein